MRNLVIDIGNTFTKFTIFDNRQKREIKVVETFDIGVLKQHIGTEIVDTAIVSTVDGEVEEIEIYLKSRCKFIRFDAGMSGKIVNKYKTPNTLGLDRLAAIIGAQSLYPDKNVLAIDAGTCITYDFIDDHRNYYGGNISPGIAMRFKAMNEFTSRLPLVEFDATFSGFYGNDTRTAMVSGVQEGIYNEAIGFINAYSQQYHQLQIVLCGGDAKFFDSRFKSSIFAHSLKIEPNLVLIGLNEVIYQHND